MTDTFQPEAEADFDLSAFDEVDGMNATPDVEAEDAPAEDAPEEDAEEAPEAEEPAEDEEAEEGEEEAEEPVEEEPTGKLKAAQKDAQTWRARAKVISDLDEDGATLVTSLAEEYREGGPRGVVDSVLAWVAAEAPELLEQALVGKDAAPEADDGDDDRPLTRREVEQLWEERQAAAAARSEQATIAAQVEQGVTALGLEMGSPEAKRVMALAAVEMEDGLSFPEALKAAHAKVIAPLDREAIIAEYLAEKRETAKSSPKVPRGGQPASERAKSPSEMSDEEFAASGRGFFTGILPG